MTSAPLTGGIDWPRFLSAMVLVIIRLSGLVVFAPVFSSEAIPSRVKVLFVLTTAIVLAPIVSALPLAQPGLGVVPIVGELSVGLMFGLGLSMVNEIFLFAGQVLGFQFSFSLVNLLDPNSSVQTPLMGQLLSLMATVVLVVAGLHRTMLLAVIHSFVDLPIGSVRFESHAGQLLVKLMAGVFFAAIQLASPVLAVTLLAEVCVALLGKISPQLPAMIISVPVKTLLGYTVLLSALALWPSFIESHFLSILNSIELLVRQAAR